MWRSERELQTDFTGWLRRAGRLGYASFRADLPEGFGRPGKGPANRATFRARGFSDVSAGYELKLVRCGRKRACGERCRSAVTRADFRGHQLEELGKLDGGEGVAHKASDMAAGYKPFDTFWLGADAAGRVVVGWVCGGGARAYMVGRGRVERILSERGRMVEEDAARWGMRLAELRQAKRKGGTGILIPVKAS